MYYIRFHPIAIYKRDNLKQPKCQQQDRDWLIYYDIKNYSFTLVKYQFTLTVMDGYNGGSGKSRK